MLVFKVNSEMSYNSGEWSYAHGIGDISEMHQSYQLSSVIRLNTTCKNHVFLISDQKKNNTKQIKMRGNHNKH